MKLLFGLFLLTLSLGASHAWAIENNSENCPLINIGADKHTSEELNPDVEKVSGADSTEKPAHPSE